MHDGGGTIHAAPSCRREHQIPERLGNTFALHAALSPLGQTYVEGTAQQILVNHYERDPAARARCIAHHGLRCQVCGLLLEERYGEIAAGFIHVHHLRPLSAMRAGTAVDPVRDLAPVCPNCQPPVPSVTPSRFQYQAL